MDKKIFSSKSYLGYRIYDANGDITKDWFIYKDGGGRDKIYKGINMFKTTEARYEAIKKKIDALIEEELKKGKTPSEDLVFIPNEKIIAALNEYSIDKQLAEGSILTYRNIIELFMRNCKLITPENTQKYFKQLRDKVKESTYNERVIVIKGVLKYCTDDVNVFFDKIKLLRENKIPYMFYSKEEASLIKEELKSDKMLEIAVMLTYYAFIRPGKEMSRLKVSDIYIEERLILLRNDVTKGQKQQFAIIQEELLPYLTGYIKGKSKNEYLFPSYIKDNEFIDKQTFNDRHNNILKKLEIKTEYKTMYSWKYTGGIHFLEDGGNIFELQRLMRHKDIKTTMGYVRDMGAEHLINARTKMRKW